MYLIEHCLSVNVVTMVFLYGMNVHFNSLGSDNAFSHYLSSYIIAWWLFVSLSLQTFVVRNSQKARYALTLRMPVDDPAVSHFLIQTNQQSKPLAIIIQTNQ